ncbi:MAG: HEAT repeat domain-containing protein [Planctomycetota bacterium]
MRIASLCLLALCGWAADDTAAPPRSVMAVAPALESADASRRIAASFELREHGADAAPAMPILARCLGDKYYHVRRNAAATLAAIGEPAIPPLIDALRERTYHRPMHAAEALGRMGPIAGEAAAELGSLLMRREQADCASRRWAAWALAQLGEGAEPALDQLMTFLEQRQPGLATRYAATAIGNIGAEARRALPLLLAIMKDTPAAKRAIGRLGPTAVAAVLAEAKASTDKKEVWAHIDTFAAFGEQAGPAIDWLVSELDPGRDQWFVAHTAAALGRIGQTAARAVPVLATVATEHGYANARRQACIALGRIGVDNDVVRAALEAAREDADDEVAAAARTALEDLAASD